MSWASARVAHGLDDGVAVEGPHERGYRWIWRAVNVCVVLLVVCLAGALVLAAARDASGWTAPDAVNDALTTLAVIMFAGFSGLLPAMFAVDRADRRRAWRDDELQAALPITHPLRRP